MKLITFTQGANPRCGLALSGTVGLDLLAADPTLPANWHALFGEMDRIRELGDRFGPRAEDAGDHPSLPLFRLAAARLLPPIVLPSKIVCVGLNYRDHAAEQNKPLPDLPMLFSKAPSCLQTHDGPIELTPDLTEVDAEAELAFVIGRPCRAVRREDAGAYIAGYMCFNDVSNREAQRRDKQFFRGKSIDTGGPCGPWIVTPDELPPEAMGLHIRCRWNDTVMQESTTDQLAFGPRALVEHASRHMTLLPGDIVATGTPGGVGVFREPPVFLKPGDLVTVEIEGIGKLANPVVRR
ncbi:MAG TPA: fumarylacetoacetate hydrolase family protein [Candidatus Krumholzibacteria bacterium]|nr:fumarylacetoacetate hydrolase family protein [Candidatus Krumholzibacteria bacterium]HPD70640.1 fumarylacetoacetate hydrolase family protein [Candidatus Krumholzibacteria bacterium]HRY39660.1 fumarylacetoacetate hydrolase family protein [Candidatus Krumholzibacteria bacterium]